MKRIIATLLLAIAGTAMAQQTLRVGTPQDLEAFYPVLTALYQEVGLVAQFVVVPAERSLKLMEAGELDADIGRVMGATKGYRNMVECKVPILESRLIAVVRQDFAPAGLTAADPKTIKYGMQRGSKFAENYVRKLGVDATVANNSRQMLQMLVAGRFDVALAVSPSILSSFPEFDSKLKQLPTPLAKASTVHVFHVKWASYAPKLDAAVIAMKADGRLAKLLPVGYK